MRRLIFTFLILLFSSSISQNGLTESVYEVGFRYGSSFFAEPEDFDSFELHILRDLPWILFDGNQFVLSPNVNLSAGLLKQDEETDIFATISSNLVLTGFDGKASFDIGGGFALVGDDRIGDHKFGGPFQFNYNFGLKFHKVYNKFGLGFRWYHISDAGINDGKGLNRNIIELIYEF